MDPDEMEAYLAALRTIANKEVGASLGELEGYRSPGTGADDEVARRKKEAAMRGAGPQGR